MKSFFKVFTIIVVFYFSLISFSFAQAFLNGDFEKTTAPAGIDQINLPNPNFSEMMENTYAFGTYGDMDIINTSRYSGAAQKGSWFVALTGGGTDAISMELSSPLIAGKSYSISFWDKASNGFIPQPFQVGVSDEKTTFGTPVYTAEMPVYGVWTKRSFSFVAPLSGKYITVQLSGVNNVGDWAQADNFSFTNPVNEIITENITGSTFCKCSNINVPFTAIGNYNSHNSFTAQLSDANGNFANPVNIGKIQSTDNTGTISCNIPCEIAASSTYRIRVISSSPEITGSDNGSDISINGEIAFVANIKAYPSNAFKEGTKVTFDLETANKSNLLQYQWQLNGLDAGSSQTFISDHLNDGDVVRLLVSIDNPCSGTKNIISNEIVMSVIEAVKPSVSIEVIGDATIQKGKSVTFVATSENEGTKPIYQWKVNGENSGGNSDVFVCKNLKDGDKVNVVMTSNAEGLSNKTVLSNSITVTVDESEETNNDKIIPSKKDQKNQNVGILKYKTFFWNKKGKRFYKIRSIAGRKKKNDNKTCYKY